MKKLTLDKRINPFCRYWRNRYEISTLVMKNLGFKIQGSDQSKTKYNSLLKIRIKVFIGHSKKI